MTAQRGASDSCAAWRLRMGELLDRAEAERDHYREALELIACDTSTFPLSAVLARNIARAALDQKQNPEEDR